MIAQVGGAIVEIGRLLFGDSIIRRNGFSLYVPQATLIAVTFVLSGILWLVMCMRR